MKNSDPIQGRCSLSPALFHLVVLLELIKIMEIQNKIYNFS